MLQRAGGEVWATARRQHGVITRSQLLELGYGPRAIEHRCRRGRLHRRWPGVYAVGSPHLGRHGLWMAAVLACGPTAMLSHGAAGALLGMIAPPNGEIEISVPAEVARRHDGIKVHRRAQLRPSDRVLRDGIPLTRPALTLVDLAATLAREPLEATVNAADRLDLISPEALRLAIDDMPRYPGRARLAAVLDRNTFRLTDSELERRMLRIVRRIGMPLPLTGVRLNGFKVDFYWPELGLVVETDGLRYHRTAFQQARDRRRDQAHAASGLTPVRFTHAQVRYEPSRVGKTLASVAARLRRLHGTR